MADLLDQIPMAAREARQVIQVALEELLLLAATLPRVAEEVVALRLEDLLVRLSLKHIPTLFKEDLALLLGLQFLLQLVMVEAGARVVVFIINFSLYVIAGIEQVEEQTVAVVR